MGDSLAALELGRLQFCSVAPYIQVVFSVMMTPSSALNIMGKAIWVMRMQQTEVMRGMSLEITCQLWTWEQEGQM